MTTGQTARIGHQPQGSRAPFGSESSGQAPSTWTPAGKESLPTGRTAGRQCSPYYSLPASSVTGCGDSRFGALALTIGCQIEISEEVVRQGLTKIGSVHLQSHEHDTSPSCDAEIHLANNSIFFAPGPAGQWVETMTVLPVSHKQSSANRVSLVFAGSVPVIRWLILLGSIRIVKYAGL